MTDAMWSALAVVIVGFLGLAGTVWRGKKNAEEAAHKAAEKSSELTIYRIDQLEEKVNKHNNLVERMFCAEKCIGLIDEKIKVANHRLDDLENVQ
jgi:hypothetical protein